MSQLELFCPVSFLQHNQTHHHHLGLSVHFAFMQFNQCWTIATFPTHLSTISKSMSSSCCQPCFRHSLHFSQSHCLHCFHPSATVQHNPHYQHVTVFDHGSVCSVNKPCHLLHHLQQKIVSLYQSQHILLCLYEKYHINED